jgi:hypothetical protein
VDLRADAASPGPATSAVRQVIRRHVPVMLTDVEIAGQLVAMRGLLGEILAAAEAVVGRLR